MKPILYSYSEQSFHSNGLGILNDAISCVVTQERNGMYELEMEYPIGGIHYEDLTLLYIIVARPDQVALPQPFRIYEITKPMNGNITVYARHLAYDLMGVPVRPFAASTITAAFTALTQNAVSTCPFTFETDKTTAATITVEAPTAIWDLLKGSDGGILDVYGGEYEFDWYTVKLLAQRGSDRGVQIRYGKNLTDLKQEASCDNWYTALYPYWMGEDGTVVEGDLLQYPGTYPVSRIRVLDLSEEWEEAPTVAQVTARAQSYRAANNLTEPAVSISVDFTHNEQVALLNHGEMVSRDTGLKIAVCDTVTVYFERLGISTAANVTKTEYDVLADRYKTIEIGAKKQTLPGLFQDAVTAAIRRKGRKS